MKIGILGLGSAGQRHALNAASMRHEVLAYDPLGGHSTREEILRDGDAIVIASPTQCHLSDLFDVLAHNKHVLVEKPIALIRQRKAVENLVELNRASTKPLIIAVGYNLRFHPAIQNLRKMIDVQTNTGRPPYWASFVCCQYTESQDALTNGCLETWATHEIDLAAHLLGGDLRLIDHHVNRFEVNLYLDKRDEPKCHVHLHSDMLCPVPLRTATVCTPGISATVNLEYDPVTNDHYREELRAFISLASGGIEDTSLASGEDGVMALRLAERAQP